MEIRATFHFFDDVPCLDLIGDRPVLGGYRLQVLAHHGPWHDMGIIGQIYHKNTHFKFFGKIELLGVSGGYRSPTGPYRSDKVPIRYQKRVI